MKTQNNPIKKKENKILLKNNDIDYVIEYDKNLTDIEKNLLVASVQVKMSSDMAVFGKIYPRGQGIIDFSKKRGFKSNKIVNYKFSLDNGLSKNEDKWWKIALSLALILLFIYFLWKVFFTV